MSSVPLSLRRENGKTITCDFNGNAVALVVWGKSGAPKLPLALTVDEARGLRTLLDAAIAKGTSAWTVDQFMSATTATRNRVLESGALKGSK